MSLREELRAFAAWGSEGPKSTGQILCERAADALDRVLPVHKQGYVSAPSYQDAMHMLEEAKGYLRSRFGVCITCAAVCERDGSLHAVVHDPNCLYMRIERALAKQGEL